ncbi:ribosome silencing factor [Agarivorans sp. MS3-6]|uniref:ribosome silencing factor n=1 Tax=Agarivorans sp. TSD2052 TaxID=2937286 RepID=UPI00200F3DC2|nr:ribosome silencing factor [Agarivorans sp. TSD2052]UPW19893.1 ribosome silencing factor [Agarivorans sp. TSD2052]
MQNQQLVDFVIDKIEDMKGRDIQSLNVSEQSTITDTMIICSGNSKRHVKSIADNVFREARLAELEVIGMEGIDESEWVLLDLGDVVLHVMQDSARDFYQLEKLWAPSHSESKAG